MATIEHDALVPPDLRVRLETARLDDLAVMRTLDHAIPLGTPLPRADVLALGQLDADCAEALWALDQPARKLDVRAMVRDSLASLEQLQAARQRLRDAVPGYPIHREAEIRERLDPAEAYSQVRGRDPAVHAPARIAGPRVGRNDPCPCGSARKFKKCCLAGSRSPGPPPAA